MSAGGPPRFCPLPLDLGLGFEFGLRFGFGLGFGFCLLGRFIVHPCNQQNGRYPPRGKKRQGDSEDTPSKVQVILDMWPVYKRNTKIYDCPFTLFIDGQFYTRSKVSVFDPKDVFQKMKEEVSGYFENFL